MIQKTKLSIIKKRGYPNWIYGDKLSLYLSNYPVAAKYLAERIGDRHKIICELCCGIGVTLARLAEHSKSVIGVEIDKRILDNCKKNLKKWGVNDKTILILGDVSDHDLLKNLKADIVIYDIPYWDIGLTAKTGLENINPDLKKLVHNIRKYITNDIIIFTPPHYYYEQAMKDFNECEYQSIYINGKYDRNYIYLGNLIDRPGNTQLML